MFVGFFGKLLFRIVNYLLRPKISLALWDEHDEKLTRPTLDLTRKYEWIFCGLTGIYELTAAVVFISAEIDRSEISHPSY